MVVAVAVAVAVAAAVANPIHPQLIKFVPKYADFGPFKSNLVAPPCLTPARKAFQGGGLFGGEPFVLLFESITFGPPAGKKEIEV